VIVYALIDPRTNDVRYVGKTIRTAQRRLRRHLAESYLAADTHKDRWLVTLRHVGLEPRIEVLERCESLHELADAERRHIAAQRATGAPLTNLTDGGDGVGGWKHTPESREKIRAALTGKPKSIEHRRNAGLAQRGRKASDATRARLSEERRRRGYYPRPRYGTDNNKTKLTAAARQEIRALRGLVSQRELGRRFGVSHAAIGKVQRSDLRVREWPKVAVLTW
jgi:hypothetical protein